MALLAFTVDFLGCLWALGAVLVSVGLGMGFGTFVLMADGGSWFEGEVAARWGSLRGKRDRGLLIGCVLAGLLLSPLVVGQVFPGFYNRALVHDEELVREAGLVRAEFVAHLAAAEAIGVTPMDWAGMPSWRRGDLDIVMMAAEQARETAELAGVTLSYGDADIARLERAESLLRGAPGRQALRVGIVGAVLAVVFMCFGVVARRRGWLGLRYLCGRAAMVSVAAGLLLPMGV